jgi:hypothetical protein
MTNTQNNKHATGTTIEVYVVVAGDIIAEQTTT